MAFQDCFPFHTCVSISSLNTCEGGVGELLELEQCILELEVYLIVRQLCQWCGIQYFEHLKGLYSGEIGM